MFISVHHCSAVDRLLNLVDRLLNLIWLKTFTDVALHVRGNILYQISSNLWSLQIMHCSDRVESDCKCFWNYLCMWIKLKNKKTPFMWFSAVQTTQNLSYNLDMQKIYFCWQSEQSLNGITWWLYAMESTMNRMYILHVNIASCVTNGLKSLSWDHCQEGWHKHATACFRH